MTRRHRRINRVVRLAAGFVGAGVLTALGALFALGAVRGRPHPAGQASSVQGIETLAATASPAPAANLTPAQQECLRRFGLLDQYRYVRTDQARQAILTVVRYCVDTLNGIPVHLDPNNPVTRLPRPVTPRPLRPEDYHATPLGAGWLTGLGNGTKPGEDRVLNRWLAFTPTASISVAVLAGSSGEDPLQGLVTVIDDPASKIVTASTPRFPTPTKHGAVKIVDAVGETLKLQADDGTIFYFDVASRQYVPGFPAGVAAPAATPPATPGP